MRKISQNIFKCFELLHVLSRSQVTRFKKPNEREIRSVCWFPTSTVTMHQIPTFQSIAVLSVPNSLSDSDDDNESLNKLQQVSFWRLESKSFTKYGEK